MRAFIAIEIPKEIKGTLMEIQEQLKSSGADVKWVESRNIHLTLKFLGETEEKKLNAINKIIEDTANTKSSYRIRISSIGAFPKINLPKVLWLGINPGEKETEEIAMELEERLAGIGIPKEDRPFSSHITIGRARSNLNRQNLVQRLKNMGSKIEQENLQFNTIKITLFRSTLTSGGPIYEALKETSLKTT